MKNTFRGTHDPLKPEGYRSATHSLLLGTLAISVLSLALPIMTLQVYDRILPNPGTGTLPVLITGVCVAIVLEACLRLCRAYVMARSSASYEHRMACLAIGKVLNADLSQIGTYGIGTHLHRMAAIGKLKDFYNGHALTVIAEMCFLPLFFGLIAYIGGWLALVPAVILGVFTVVSVVRGVKLRDALLQREDADDKRFNFLIESLEGIHTLKSFALEQFFVRRYEALEEDSCVENYHVAQETARTFNTGAIFSHIMVIAVISAGAWFVLQGNLTTGGLIAVLLLSGRIMQPVQKALALWARYQDYLLACNHIETLFATPQQQIKPRDGLSDYNHDGTLSLRGVSFRHKGEGQALFDDVNLELRHGDCVLLSGAHGSGKTTLLKLISGVYPASAGKIIVDGYPVDSYRPEELVNHIGFVHTTPLIFRGTIRENITCFGQTEESKAREVAALLDVDKDVAKLPSGFDTFLSGNHIDSISPGLMQRIAITRTLASKPRIILFDNAERALDKNGYGMVYSLLARLKGKATMVLLSDDRNIRALADKHYVLADGKLVAGEDTYSKGNVRPYKELKL